MSDWLFWSSKFELSQSWVMLNYHYRGSLRTQTRVEMRACIRRLPEKIYRRSWCRRENQDFHVFRTQRVQSTFYNPGGERSYTQLTSKQSMQFFYKLLIIKYTSNMPIHIVSCLRFLCNANISFPRFQFRQIALLRCCPQYLRRLNS